MPLTSEQRAQLKKQFFAPSASPGSSGLDERIARSRALSGTTTAETDIQRESVAESTQEQVAEAKKPGLLSRTLERAKAAGRDIKSTFQRAKAGEQTPIETGVQVTGEVAGAISGTVFDTLFTAASGAVKTLTPKVIEEQVGRGGKALLDSEVGRMATDAILRGEEAYSTFKQENPRAAANIEGVLGILEVVPAKKAVSATQQAVRRTQDVATRARGVVSEAAPAAIREPFEQAARRKTAGIVEEVIKPKLTKREISRALEEGRVERVGGIKKLLGAADNVKAEQKVKDAADTIAREIEGARKMTDQQLAVEAQNAVKRIGESVRPKLKKLEVTEELRNDILDNYLVKKSEQLDDLILSDTQIAKAQKKFEDIVLNIDETQDVDQLWKMVTDYDKSIPKNIKEATSQSSDALQAQKDIWLDNRRVLRDALDDAVKLADDTVKQEFKDMSGLYTARQNIVSAGRLNKGARNRVRNALLTGVATGLGVGGGGLFLID